MNIVRFELSTTGQKKILLSHLTVCSVPSIIICDDPQHVQTYLSICWFVVFFFLVVFFFFSRPYSAVVVLLSTGTYRCIGWLAGWLYGTNTRRPYACKHKIALTRAQYICLTARLPTHSSVPSGGPPAHTRTRTLSFDLSTGLLSHLGVRRTHARTRTHAQKRFSLCACFINLTLL